MTEKELLSKETFIKLFNMSEIDKIEKENELYLRAKELGISKKYQENLKKYEAIFKDKILLDAKATLPKCKYDIQSLDTGKYICRSKGITDSKTDNKFSHLLIFPIERYINQDTGKEKIKKFIIKIISGKKK